MQRLTRLRFSDLWWFIIRSRRRKKFSSGLMTPNMGYTHLYSLLTLTVHSNSPVNLRVAWWVSIPLRLRFTSMCRSVVGSSLVTEKRWVVIGSRAGEFPIDHLESLPWMHMVNEKARELIWVMNRTQTKTVYIKTPWTPSCPSVHYYACILQCDVAKSLSYLPEI